MSTIPGEIIESASSGPSRSERLSLPARIYFVFAAALAASISVPLLPRLQSTSGWLTFAILASGAATARLFSVRLPNNQAYHADVVFLIAAVILLPPELVAPLGAISMIPEWLKYRYRWPLQTFNICNHTIDIMAAWGVAHLLNHGSLVSNDQLKLALAGAAASLVYVALNHGVLAVMLRFAYGHTARETGLFTFENLSTEVVLAALGVAMATFWNSNAWVIPFVLAPLLLIHRSLSVPALQAEARVDPKTGLYNARYFASALAEELGRAERFGRPMCLLMADLDLLRDINNTYGHLAGDAVLQGIAEIFRAQLRHYDVPARFGGEEFSILLPETPPEQALEIAERIRKAVSETSFDVETSSEPIHATVSIGVAGYPKDGADANELIHQADLAVYRAKLQGRNRVLGASSEPLLMPADRGQRLVAVPEEGDHHTPLPTAAEIKPPEERRTNPRPHALQGPRFFALSHGLALLVGLVCTVGIGAGVLGAVLGSSHDFAGLIAIVALVGAGQALSLETDDGTISVAAVGSLAAASLFGLRAALAVAVTTAVVEWSARRQRVHQVLFNIGALVLASLGSVGVFSLAPSQHGGWHDLIVAVLGIAAGATYFGINMSLISFAVSFEGHGRWRSIFKEQFSWLLPHYVVYGFVGSVMAIAYEAAGLYALAVFAVPLLLMRKTQAAYLAHTQRSAQKLRQAAETIQSQNVSLEQANRLLKERSTAAMESLSATVDARDSYTAGHSRRVQQLALAIGRELNLSQAELDLLGHAALFHDIGKLAIPDAILLKPASLTEDEWALMQRHADEGARIIDRLGFLNDAVPAIRHHHERFDGTGYPDGLKGEEIPLGARIIHVADALDSMLTTRIYRAARPASEALGELRRAAGSQFCPRCVSALERILPVESLESVGDDRDAAALVAAAS
jgi:diguanylate cyclase (GGDEF)-like protein/putative nucleotidyltransferase with HDIG domain